MRTIHISEDGKKQYGEKYKHLADLTIEMPEPNPGVNESYRLVKNESDEFVWEYSDNRTEEEKEIADLRATVDQLVMDKLMGGM